jgi:hypothetical protein
LNDNNVTNAIKLDDRCDDKCFECSKFCLNTDDRGCNGDEDKPCKHYHPLWAY